MIFFHCSLGFLGHKQFKKNKKQRVFLKLVLVEAIIDGTCETIIFENFFPKMGNKWGVLATIL